MSSFAAASVPVKVKWGKNSYDVAIDPAGGVMQFKAEIYSLTGGHIALKHSTYRSYLLMPACMVIC